MVASGRCDYGLYGSSASSSHSTSRIPRALLLASLSVASLTAGYMVGNTQGSELFGAMALRSSIAERFATFSPVSSNVQPRSSSAIPAHLKQQMEPPRRASMTPLNSVAQASSEFSLGRYLQEKAAAVEVALDKYVPAELPPHPKLIFDAMRHSLLAGGKRIRPVLVIAACEMVGGTQEMAMPTACALEMIHTMSLIHDDLPMMDNDDFRRGKPTCHKVYGEAVALLAGDALLAQSFSLIAKETKGVPADRVLKSIANLGTLVGSEGLVGGQVMDMESEGLGHLATLETVEYIHIHKTAVLLEAAVYNGACIGGASDAELEMLRRFAQKIGLAFQIIDDVLDATMSAEQLGKTAGKDEAVSKATYVKVVGLEESRAMAERLISEAKADLKVYGDKALPLLALADFITARKN